MRLSQGVLARVGDVPAAIEVECLEIQTSSSYFQTLASVILLQFMRLSDWRFEHRLATSITLAFVMFLQLLRVSVWRFEHRLATSITLASVILLQHARLSD